MLNSCDTRLLLREALPPHSEGIGNRETSPETHIGCLTRFLTIVT